MPSYKLVFSFFFFSLENFIEVFVNSHAIVRTTTPLIHSTQLSSMVTVSKSCSSIPSLAYWHWFNLLILFRLPQFYLCYARVCVCVCSSSLMEAHISPTTVKILNSSEPFKPITIPLLRHIQKNIQRVKHGFGNGAFSIRIICLKGEQTCSVMVQKAKKALLASVWPSPPL